jgi:hypothetical protein
VGSDGDAYTSTDAMDASQKKKKRVKNASWLRRARQKPSYQGEVLLKRAAEAGNGGDVDDHMSLRDLPLRR